MVEDIYGSKLEFSRAKKVIPGGLVSRIRRRDNQLVFQRGSGAHLWDVDGNKYVDCVLAHGPILLGHSDERVTKAVTKAAGNGVLLGGVSTPEIDLAERAVSQLPFAEKVTFMSTGTEAVQLAIRIARSATRREIVVKFQGHYHGWMDPLYVNVPGFELQGTGIIANPGLFPGSVETLPAVQGARAPLDVVVTPWSDLESFKALMNEIGDRVAAVIMEPLLTGFGTFAPQTSYLQGVKDTCHAHGALLIFDEVVSGFRSSPAGAAGLLEVYPDVGVYAKAMANGYPISMVASSNEIMECVTDGRVPSSGTYSGSPVPVAASIATLDAIAGEGAAFYQYMDDLGARLKNGLVNAGISESVPITVNQIGSILQILCGEIHHPNTVQGVNSSDRDFVARVCEIMIRHGVYMSRKGLILLSRAHTEADVDIIVAVFEQALALARSNREVVLSEPVSR